MPEPPGISYSFPADIFSKHEMLNNGGLQVFLDTYHITEIESGRALRELTYQAAQIRTSIAEYQAFSLDKNAEMQI